MSASESSPAGTAQNLLPEPSIGKRVRRIKHDPAFIFGNSATFDADMDVVPPPIKPKVKKLKAPVEEENTVGADSYEPGDIVWSKLGSFPWWPALIYRCDAEGGKYTKTLSSNNKSKRQFFVYFYGKYLEYAWLSTRSLLNYSGLSDFIQHAEDAVHQASTKSEQVELANRYQLKVSMKKRLQWDESIELADRALKMTKAERIQEFVDLLNEAQGPKLNTRRRKASMGRGKNDQTSAKKRPDRTSSSSHSTHPSTPIPNGTSSTPSTSAAHHPKEKKSGRGAKPPSTAAETFSAVGSGRSTRVRTSPSDSSSTKKKSHSTSKPHTGTERDDDATSLSPAIRHLLESNIPPLSAYEQKQIVESLMHHSNQEKPLTFDDAQALATSKALEIANKNYHYHLTSLSADWFYDAILLKYPSVAFKYRSWFAHVNVDEMPDETDSIQLKQWQIALMLRAQMQAEARQSSTNALE